MNYKRPYVSINKESCLNELLDALSKNMHRMKQFDQIAGIMLDGGMSRGYADYLSEIDVVIFLHTEAFKAYQEKKTPVGLGITMLDGYLYDIKILNYEDEWNRSYDNVSLWDLSYAKILYDENGELQKLFDRKLKNEVNVGIAEGMMFDAWWHFKLAGDIWIQREDALQGHYCLNHAIQSIISSLFIANKEYIPHEKWLLHMSRTLEWKPEHYEELLKESISTGDMSIQSLNNRQQSIERLWNAIDIRLCDEAEFHTGLNLMYKDTYRKFERLILCGEMTIEEWKENNNFSSLNYEPFYSLAEVKNGKVMVKKEKLQTIDEKEMYSWFLDIVKAVRTNIK